MLNSTLTTVAIIVAIGQILAKTWTFMQRNARAVASGRDTAAYDQLLRHAQLLDDAGREDLAIKKAEQAYRALVTAELYPRLLQPPLLWLPLGLGLLAPVLTAGGTFLHPLNGHKVVTDVGLILVVVSATWAINNMFWQARVVKRVEAQIKSDAQEFWARTTSGGTAQAAPTPIPIRLRLLRLITRTSA